MLSITAQVGDPRTVEADLLAVPMFKGGIEGPGTATLLAALGLDDVPITPSFRGEAGQHLLLAAPGVAAGGILLVGLGRMDETDPERLRRVAAVAARAAREARTLATTLAAVHPTAASVEAVAEGLALGAYDDRRFRSDAEPPTLREATVLVPSSRLAEARTAVERARLYAKATCDARDLVNLPPSHKRPPDLAVAIAELAGGACDVDIVDERALAERGFGGVVAVGQGSDAPPRLVELRYRPENPLGHVVLVGKGITFDTGGLSIKTRKQMETMKSDMAGAATVAAVCAAAQDLEVRLQVTGLLPLAENLPSGDAQRPDDVIKMYDGTTVEVADTDAEGRLVLGDALAYGAGMEPDAIVDLATLTGSAIVALGQYAAALFGSDRGLVEALQAAAATAGEDVWPMPLWPDLERYIGSAIADVRNVGDGPLGNPGGGAITAALFLRRFVGDVPWAHLDIAGPAFVPAELARDYLPAGATGFGVRTLLTWLERRTT